MPDWVAVIVIVTAGAVISYALGALLTWMDDSPPRPKRRGSKRRGSFWHSWSDSPHRPRR